jgi:hypothetical protein
MAVSRLIISEATAEWFGFLADSLLSWSCAGGQMIQGGHLCKLKFHLLYLVALITATHCHFWTSAAAAACDVSHTLSTALKRNNSPSVRFCGGYGRLLETESSKFEWDQLWKSVVEREISWRNWELYLVYCVCVCVFVKWSCTEWGRLDWVRLGC